MSQELLLKLRGLYTAPNQFLVPQGALVVAENGVIDENSVFKSRRGQAPVGTTLASGTAFHRIFPFENSLIAHYNSTLAYDPDQNFNWVNYDGTFDAPEEGRRIRDTLANGNLYITTSGGVKKLDELQGTWRDSGAPQGLSSVFTTVTGSTGIILASGTVAYRNLVGYTDAKDNEIVGAPSQRTIITSAPDKQDQSANVSIETAIPDGITTQWFWRFYRSVVLDSLTGDPGDNLQLTKEGFFTQAEIDTGIWTFTDDTPDELLGANLYTNQQEQGILQANDQPPFAKDLTTYKDMTLYANTRSLYNYKDILRGVGEGSFGYLTVSGATTSGNGNITLSGVNDFYGGDTSDIHDGMRVVGSAVISGTTVSGVISSSVFRVTPPPTGTGFLEILELQDSITVAGQSYYAGSSTDFADHQFEAVQDDTPSVNIIYTAQNLVNTINRNPDNEEVYAFYISAENEVPGQILYRARTLAEPVFYLTSTYGAAWLPELPSSGTDQAAVNDIELNRVYISKVSQPEAVPTTNSVPVGKANIGIGRILALRESAIVLKQGDGVWTMTGDSAPLQPIQIDPSVNIIAPETAVVLNNQVFCWTAEGIVTITDAGAEIKSIPIQTDLYEVSSENFPDFASMAFCVPYSSDHQLHFFTPTETSDEVPTQDWVYNFITDGWTNWPISRTCGVINPRDNKLYMGDPITGKIRKERKAYTRLDFADAEISTIIVSSSGTLVTVDSTTGIEDGWTLKQSSRESLIVAVSGTIIEVVDETSWTAGSAIAYEPIRVELAWAPFSGGNPGIVKHYDEATYLFKKADFDTILAGFSSSFNPSITYVELPSSDLSGGWGGRPWGEGAWGEADRREQGIRTWIPRQKRQGLWHNFSLVLEQAFSSFSCVGLSVILEPMSPRFGRPRS